MAGSHDSMTVVLGKSRSLEKLFFSQGYCWVIFAWILWDSGICSICSICCIYGTYLFGGILFFLLIKKKDNNNSKFSHMPSPHPLHIVHIPLFYRIQNNVKPKNGLHCHYAPWTATHPHPPGTLRNPWPSISYKISWPIVIHTLNQLPYSHSYTQSVAL